eukprot:TRINITY_DN91212_c0_g1_i1.p1 TRINITY_DN91212_c0_g1~~TRINITY_DN91212_c0_g1_i1.p1  ORF type:complete len:334 (-),score=88.92 TRINITY_DN91212_c0_g1_i1:330-1331(-)
MYKVFAAALALPAAAASAPPTVTLSNGVKMPLLAAGVYQYNSTEAEASIKAALSVGFTSIDTALDYWNQDGVGRALKSAMAGGMKREDVFVQTKIPGCGNPAENRTRNPLKCYEDAKSNLEYNLQQLDLPYVDSVIIHFPPFPSFIARSCTEWNGACKMVRDQWKAMEEFYKAGKAKAIGVSNYCPSCFECLKDADVKPMINQVMYHVGMGADPGHIISYGTSKECVTQAYSALGNTPWTHAADPFILHGNLTSDIAKAHNVSTVAVALKFLVAQSIPAVTKSSNPAHLKDDLDLWSWNFTEDEFQRLVTYERMTWLQKYSFGCNSLSEDIVV